jgi:hypothetical protein
MYEMGGFMYELFPLAFQSGAIKSLPPSRQLLTGALKKTVK